MTQQLRLVGGPYDGTKAPRLSPVMNVSGSQTPEGFVDVYTLEKGDPDVYRFQTTERVVAEIALGEEFDV